MQFYQVRPIRKSMPIAVVAPTMPIPEPRASSKPGKKIFHRIFFSLII